MKKKFIITPKETIQLFIISLFSSLFAYVLIYFLTNMAALYFAFDFDIPAHFNLHTLTFDIEKTSRLWSYDAKVTLLVVKPITALFIGIFSLSALMFVRKKLMSFFFFLMWLNILAFNSAVGVIADDVIAKSGIYDIAVLMNIDVSILIVISVFAIYFLFRIGIIDLYIFQASFPKIFFKSRKNRSILLSIIIILPWLLMFILPMVNSTNSYQIITLLKNSSILFLLLPLFVFKPKKNKFTNIEKVTTPQKYDILNIILFALGTWLLYYFMIDGVYLRG